MKKKNVDFRKLAKAAAKAADDKKGIEILVLDIRKDSDVADYVVIAGADSTAQLRAIEGAVEDGVEAELGLLPLHKEARPQNRWHALDYGGVLVHILLSDAREFYRLESLWEKQKVVKVS